MNQVNLLLVIVSLLLLCYMLYRTPASEPPVAPPASSDSSWTYRTFRTGIEGDWEQKICRFIDTLSTEEATTVKITGDVSSMYGALFWKKSEEPKVTQQEAQ